MIKRKAFITGINGQDGSYLAEHLLEKDYEVYGIVRRNSIAQHQESRIHHLQGKINLEYGDLLDVSSLERIISHIKPDEISSYEEAFLTGTAAHIQAVGRLDNRDISDGKSGKYTSQINEIYQKAIRGETPKYRGWCTEISIA